MLEGDVVNQEDANFESEGPSSLPEPSAQEQTPSAESDGGGRQSEPQVPFHEHPRFKELIEERRQYASQLAQMQQQMEELRARATPKEEPKSHPFVQKLSEIDPTYGEWANSVEGLKEKLQQFESWQQDQQQKAIVKEYESTVERLNTEGKVSPEIAALIKETLDARALSGQIKSLKDVPAVYKEVSERFTKLFESQKREQLKNYVQDKSKDAKVPMTGKGKAPTPPKKTEGRQDRESLYSSIVKAALTQTGAEGDI